MGRIQLIQKLDSAPFFGIGKEAFLDWYKEPLDLVYDDDRHRRTERRKTDWKSGAFHHGYFCIQRPGRLVWLLPYCGKVAVNSVVPNWTGDY